MAKKKASKKKAQPKATAPAKVAVVFKKDAPDGALPPQAAEILSIVKGAGKIERIELLKKMQGRVKTKQTMATIFSFYRSTLVRLGCITVTA
jgi:hypothetical protein